MLRALLAERNWTQQTLAEKSGIGRTTINAYCAPPDKKSHRDLGYENVAKLARAFEISPTDLGAPPSNGEPTVLLPRRLLRELEAEVAALKRGAAGQARSIVALKLRLDALEHPPRRQARPNGKKG